MMDTPSLLAQALPDTLGTWVAVLLTLVVFSYLLADHLLYRLAEHLFVGVTLGYVAVLVIHNILGHKLLFPFISALGRGDWEQVLWLLLPLVLGLLLLTKSLPIARSVTWVGNLSVAFLLGVGAALAISGALWGTIVPQVDATADIRHFVPRYGPVLGLFSGLLVLLGTIGVLLHFRLVASQRAGPVPLLTRCVHAWGGLGRWLTLVAFGALLASTFRTHLSLLIGRILFLVEGIGRLVGG
jgi:hypothetical protein